MSNLTYTSGRPAGNISPAAQRASMQTNNDNNATIWEQDHYGFNNEDGGTHKQMRLPDVAAPGAQTDPASVYYTKQAASNVFTQYSIPFFRNQAGEFALIADLMSSASTYGNNRGFKLGQLIFNFGRGEIQNGSQSETITWTIAFTTAVYSIICSKDGNGIGSSANSLTINGKSSGLTQGIFTAQSSVSSGNMPYFYLAIGY